jgi:hypothetical protein
MKMKLILIVAILPLLFTCLSQSNIEPDSNLNSISSKEQEPKTPKGSIKSFAPHQRKQSFQFKKFEVKDIIEALKKGYPNRIEAAEFRKGDWALKIRDQWFYWEEGKLLPEEDRENRILYTPYPFYSYGNELPELPNLTPKEKIELEIKLEAREHNPPKRHPGFFNALWRINNRKESWERVKTIYFFGLKTQIHRDLLEDLAKIEEILAEKMKSDKELKNYINKIVNVQSYNYRKIAGTHTLSFHSYGIAIDLLPPNYFSLPVYWRWIKKKVKEWYLLPYSQRFHPPEILVKTFEDHGFIWGGKWFFWDTIHFEYRPEILILNKIQ